MPSEFNFTRLRCLHPGKYKRGQLPLKEHLNFMLTIAIIALICRTEKGQFMLFRLCGVTPLAIRYKAIN